MSNELQPKIYPCFNCQAQLHLIRNEQNQRWDKYNLDGTPHRCTRKKADKQQQQPTQNNNGHGEDNNRELLLQIISKLENIETIIKSQQNR